MPTFQESLSIPYRLFVNIIGLVIFFRSILYKFTYKNFNTGFLFVIFWVIYLTRLFLDLYLFEIEIFEEQSKSYYILSALSIVFFPTISLYSFNWSKVDFEYILKWLYGLLLFALLIGLILRNNEDNELRSTGGVFMGVLNYGHYGATLSILSFYYIFVRRSYKIFKVIYVFGFFLGLTTVFITSSKSPIIALGVVILLYYLVFFDLKKIIILLILLIIGYFYFIDFYELVSKYYPNAFLQRFIYSLTEDQSFSGRENLLMTGWQEFVEKPFFGSAFLIQNEKFIGSYPHNLIIESFMALGILGGFIFIWYLKKCLIITRSHIKKNSNLVWIAFLFLQYFIFGMFSGNIFSSELFWIFSLILILTKPEKFRLKHK